MNSSDIEKIIKTASKELNELPTAKQINFAKEISEVLDIPLPDKKTKAAYKAFINFNIDAYKEVMSACKEDSYWFEELGG